jgi:hypothetical protein
MRRCNFPDEAWLVRTTGGTKPDHLSARVIQLFANTVPLKVQCQARDRG